MKPLFLCAKPPLVLTETGSLSRFQIRAGSRLSLLLTCFPPRLSFRAPRDLCPRGPKLTLQTVGPGAELNNKTPQTLHRPLSTPYM